MRDSIVVDARDPPRASGLRELWRYRELFVVFAQRDIAVRYQETVLGVVWAVLQPVGMMLVFTVVFSRILQADSTDVPYPLFAFAGLLPWMLFSNSVSAAAQSVLASRGLISKVYFPRLVIPLSALGAPLLDFCLASALMVPLMLYYGHPLHLGMLAIPFVALFAAATAAAFGSLFAAAMVLYRDVRHVLPFVLSIWLFLTPVIYPPSLVPAQWQWVLLLNPMTGVVEASRAAWLGRSPDAGVLATSLGLAVVFLVLGIAYFRSVERRFADVI